MNLTIIDRNFNGQTVQTTNSRDLHEFLGVKSAFNDWINRRIKDYEFQEGLDSTHCYFFLSSNNFGAYILN